MNKLKISKEIIEVKPDHFKKLEFQVKRSPEARDTRKGSSDGKIIRTKNKERYTCPKLGCNFRFISWQQRNRHDLVSHPEPKKTVEEMRRYGESHSLLGGSYLKIGDKISFNKVAIVTKVIRTENSNDVTIECAVISDYFSKQ